MNIIFSIILYLFVRNSYSIRDELCEYYFSYFVVIDIVIWNLYGFLFE